MTSKEIAAPVWSTEPTRVVLSIEKRLKLSSSFDVETISIDAHTIIAERPIRNSTSNTITFDVNLIQQATPDLSFEVGDVLTFQLRYTYTDMEAQSQETTLK